MAEKSCDDTSRPEASPHSVSASTAETESPPSYDSQTLLRGTREVLIRHQGETYRLRLTRNDKLILHK